MKKLLLLVTTLLVVAALPPKPLFAQDQRIWATYFGAEQRDYNGGIVTDADGNVYMAGRTENGSLIAYGGFQNTYGGGLTDAYLVKFDSLGNRLWATYYGGTGSENANDLAIDASGNIYMAGETSSLTGIAYNGHQNTNGGSGTTPTDAFLVKFDSQGNRLWATYYGGFGSDYGYTVTCDVDGNVYLGGTTSGTSALSYNGFQNTNGGINDAYLVKFDSTGARLWATYYGGEGYEYCYGLATDVFGNVYMAGVTNGSSGLSHNGFLDTLSGGIDGLLVKFDSQGNRVWATYYGGSSNDHIYSVITDGSGNIYVSGITNSVSGISYNGHQDTLGGGEDTYLVKFDSTGNRLWATYYGGEANEGPYQSNNLAIDTAGNLYMSGDTYSETGIGSTGFQDTLNGYGNTFLVKFNSAGDVECSTYYGALFELNGLVAADEFGNVYLCGYTSSATGIASNGFQNTITSGGLSDAFLVRFTNCSPSIPVSINETSFDDKLHIFPNPASTEINIQSHRDTPSIIKVFNVQGQEVLQSTSNSNNSTLNITGLSAGLYYLHLFNDEGSAVKMFEVIR